MEMPKSRYYYNKLKEEKQRQKTMLQLEYVTWFENFVEKRPEFIMEEVLHDSNLEELDRENMSKFSDFYKIIEEYAKRNFISFKNSDPMIFSYRIRYKNHVYEIGKVSKDGLLYYAKKIDPKEHLGSIDLEDVLLGRNRRNRGLIENDLESIKKMIKISYERGIPVDVIEEVLQKALYEIKELDSRKGMRR